MQHNQKVQQHKIEKATPISPHALYLVELWLAYSLPLIFIQGKHG